MAAFKLAHSLPQILIVRRLRNGCREFLTNYRLQIGVWQQIRWYFKTYRASIKDGTYRVYLFYDQNNRPAGYGGIQLEDGALLITECVASNQRGKGYGSEILKGLIRIGQEEKRTLVAEIWASNAASIGLHEKFGFSLQSSRQHNGETLNVYKLNHSSDENWIN
jgi:RimJ/RimL family protein N-acetyltransferase